MAYQNGLLVSVTKPSVTAGLVQWCHHSTAYSMLCGLQHLLEMPCLYDSLNRGSDNLCWLTWYQIMVVGNQLVHPCTPKAGKE